VDSTGKGQSSIWSPKRGLKRTWGLLRSRTGELRDLGTQKMHHGETEHQYSCGIIDHMSGEIAKIPRFLRKLRRNKSSPKTFVHKDGKTWARSPTREGKPGKKGGELMI